MIKLHTSTDTTLSSFLSFAHHEAEQMPYMAWGGYFLAIEGTDNIPYTKLPRKIIKVYHSMSLPKTERLGRLVAFHPIGIKEKTKHNKPEQLKLPFIK